MPENYKIATMVEDFLNDYSCRRAGWRSYKQEQFSSGSCSDHHGWMLQIENFPAGQMQRDGSSNAYFIKKN